MSTIRRVLVAAQEQIRHMPEFSDMSDDQIISAQDAREVGRSQTYIYLRTTYSREAADSISTDLWQHVCNDYGDLPGNIRAVVLDAIFELDGVHGRSKMNAVPDGAEVLEQNIVPFLFAGEPASDYVATERGYLAVDFS